jgi:RNA polymerase sigma factor (sigma-70 family)
MAATTSTTQDAHIIELLRQAHTKEQGFRLLMEAYKQRLYWHIRRMLVVHDDADDVLQESFIKAWKYFDNFREESSIYTWLYRIATNNCLTFLEAKKKKQQHLSNIDPSDMQYAVKAEHNFDANKLEWQLQLAINSLPEKQRLVFNMRYYDNMPYEQMSEVLDTSVGALKASYHHAAKKIQENLTQH